MWTNWDGLDTYPPRVVITSDMTMVQRCLELGTRGAHHIVRLHDLGVVVAELKRTRLHCGLGWDRLDGIPIDLQ